MLMKLHPPSALELVHPHILLVSVCLAVCLQIGPLVAGLSSRPAQHQAICLRVAVAALEHFPPLQGSSIPVETSPLMLQKFPFLGSKEVHRFLLDWD